MRKITKVIHRLVKKWDKLGYGAMTINAGNCDEFATELEERFPKGRAWWGDDFALNFKTNHDLSGHCFFKYGKLFYDSECPQGTKKPYNLPYYQRCRKEDAEYWAKEKTA